MTKNGAQSVSNLAKQARTERARRSSGRREGRVLEGHDKMGRPKHRLEGTLATRRQAPRQRASRVATRPRSARLAYDPERFPNLAAFRQWEHAQHVLRGMRMGLTRKQAEAHARSDERDGVLEQE